MLIGTHNSASYEFNFNISFWDKKTKWEWLRLLAKFFPCIRNKIIDISKCQMFNISEQLKMGVRVLDLRISFANNTFYISHTFCCVTLTDVLIQIKDYMDSINDDSSKNLPIILMISPDYNNKHTLINKEKILISTFQTYLESYLDTNKILAYYKPININIYEYKEFKDLGGLNNIWFNSPNVEDFCEKFFNTDFENIDDLGCILTPPDNLKKWYNYLRTYLKISIKKYSEHINHRAILLLMYRILENKSLPKTCTFDYVNRELIDRHQSLFCGYETKR